VVPIVTAVTRERCTSWLFTTPSPMPTTNSTPAEKLPVSVSTRNPATARAAAMTSVRL
jgi:hypothetical protein